jgi:hypothetical protein
MKRKAHFQRTLEAQSSFEKYGRKSKREHFLDEMNKVVPWAGLLALVEPHYPKAGNGRRPVGLEIMLRAYFVQQWFNLSDPGVEDALYESPALRRFAGVDLGMAAAPDETTILRFRHLLEEHDLGGAMLDAVNGHLAGKGSRNLTFDRCWDTVVALDGDLTDRSNAFAANHPLGDFIEALPGMSLRTLPRLRRQAHDLDRQDCDRAAACSFQLARRLRSK